MVATLLAARRRVRLASAIGGGPRSSSRGLRREKEVEMGDAVTVGRLEPSFWRDTLAPYATPDVRRGLLDVATSAVAYLLLTALMYALLDVSAVLVVALAIPAGGFL